MAQQHDIAPIAGTSGDTGDSQATSSPVGAHPYRTFWQTHDLDAWANALAPDVAVYSPIFRAASLFSGRETTIDLYGVLFDVLVEFKITDELHDGNLSVFSWHAEIGSGEGVEGVDFVRTDDHGKVREIKVMIRPLVSVAVFAKAVGPGVAAKRGKLRGLVVRMLTIPLPAMFTAIDKIASLLLIAT
jgi:SnoaL-like domain